jgi:hypothetical protein
MTDTFVQKRLIDAGIIAKKSYWNTTTHLKGPLA